MREVIPESLSKALSENRVVPFVGAGVSMSILGADGRRLFPSWKELLINAADRLEGEGQPEASALVKAAAKQNKYDIATEHSREALAGGVWYDLIKESFDKNSSEADASSLALTKLIWGLGSRLVITTNYDRSLQWACPEKSDFRAWDIEARKEQVDLIREGRTDRPTVWHLHGHIDNSTDIILTPESYKKLYTEAKHRAALETLRDIMKTKSLLFIGFSLDDEALVSELIGNEELYRGASSRHFLLARSDLADRIRQRKLPISIIPYENHSDLPGIISAMCAKSREGNHQFVPDSRYYVDTTSGIHLFGGRSPHYFKIYDEAISKADKNIDILSLKLSRFRTQWRSSLFEIGARTRIRIALLDPSFPFPEDGYSVASLREREERATVGSVRSDIAKWHGFLSDFKAAQEIGEFEIQDGCGIEIKLYNTLPTVNLFRVDRSVFIGPYLLDIDNENTPTFLVQDLSIPGVIGSELFAVYRKHFEAVWADDSSRSLSDVSLEEVGAWQKGSR